MHDWFAVKGDPAVTTDIRVKGGLAAEMAQIPAARVVEL